MKPVVKKAEPKQGAVKLRNQNSLALFFAEHIYCTDGLCCCSEYHTRIFFYGVLGCALLGAERSQPEGLSNSLHWIAAYTGFSIYQVYYTTKNPAISSNTVIEGSITGPGQFLRHFASSAIAHETAGLLICKPDTVDSDALNLKTREMPIVRCCPLFLKPQIWFVPAHSRAWPKSASISRCRSLKMPALCCTRDRRNPTVSARFRGCYPALYVLTLV